MTDKIDDGGPAHPFMEMTTNDGGFTVTPVSVGLTKRDWFAGMALQGLMARKNWGQSETAASIAWALADEMIKARSQ